MSLVNPIWLWGLSALAIPVAIHLLSRKEGPVIRIGSIRFLTETSTSKFSSIRLNEVVLLAIRTLLLVCLVLFLAGLLWPSGFSKHSKKWVVVEGGLDQNENLKPVLDSLRKEGYESRILANGFPSTSNGTASNPDYYKLSGELAKEKADAIVFARNTLANFKGKRAELPPHVNWIAWPQTVSADRNVIATGLKPIQISVAYEPEFTHDKTIMLAALEAIQSLAQDKVTIHEIPVENFKAAANNDFLIWLSKQPVTYSGRLLGFRADTSSKLIVQDTKNRWLLTKRLTEDNAIEYHLAIQLVDALFNDQHQTQLNAGANLTVSNELAWSKTNTYSQSAVAEAGISLDNILLISVLILFVAERLLAFYRRQ
ncbi:MAG: BatA domain-containing protein [Cyclobacteriaceae bacterium]